jgi:LysM repeat protein
MSRWLKLWLILLLIVSSTYFAFPTVAANRVLLMPGTKGSLVSTIQSYLQQLNYFKQNPTGYYGTITMEAVKSFQLEHGLVANGFTDTDTFTAIQQAYTQKNKFTEYTVLPAESLRDVAVKFNTSIAALMVQNQLSGNEIAAGQKLIIPAVGTGNRTGNSRSRTGIIQPVPWSIVDQLWKKCEIARIIDVNTGKSFQVKRLYGYYHADIEPLTKHDTQTLKEIYGGHWSWNRRAVIVQIHNLYLAASINGMPHGGRSIYDNNFPGQFCAHFLGSRVHKGSRVDPEHQAMIDKAADAILPLAPEYILRSFKARMEEPVSRPYLER